MSLSAKLRRAPARMATGAFILSTGLGKLRSDDEEMAKGIHGMARTAYPVVDKTDPKTLLKVLGAGEVALGGALLLPIVPAGVAGLGLAAFAGGLLGVYWRSPGMRRDVDDPRPSQQGTAMAKDVWLFGIGTGLAIDSVLSGAERRKPAAKEARKTAAAQARVSRARAAGTVKAQHLAHDLAHSVKERIG